ncbi:hypothetical protein LKC16_001924 [Escherichia coli]|nr:hypothetical protein [Escherichia coli]
MADRYQPDLTLSSKALVVALINHDNGLSLSPDEIVISGVGPIDLGVESARTSQAYIAKARKPNGKKITVLTRSRIVQVRYRSRTFIRKERIS